MYTRDFLPLLALTAAACAGDPEAGTDDASGEEELHLGGTFPPSETTLATMNPTSGFAGTTVTITGARLGELACVGGSKISRYFLAYGDTSIGCTYNPAAGSITVVVPATATASAPFKLKQYVSHPFCMPECRTLTTVAVSPLFTLTSPPGE